MRIRGGDTPTGRHPIGIGHAGGSVVEKSILALSLLIILEMLSVSAHPGDATLAKASEVDSVTVSKSADSLVKGRSWYYMTDEATDVPLYCLDPDDYSPEPSSSLSYESAVNIPAIDYALYHGFQGDTGITIGGFSSTNAQDLYLITQITVACIIDGSTTMARRQFIYELLDNPNDPRYLATLAFYEECLSYSGGGIEDGCALRYSQHTDYVQDLAGIMGRGRISVTKTGAASEATDGNDLYSLEGAIFDIYADEGLTELVGTIVSDEHGNAGPSDFLNGGNYWIKERKAPDGYSVATEATPIAVSSGMNSTSIEDEPLFARAALVTKKIDAETGYGVGLGSASLSGALFIINFYDGDYSLDDLPAAPTKSWTVITDDSGAAFLDQEHLVDGDALYLDRDGNAVIPLGTLTIVEFKPPRGYLVNTNIHITHVTVDQLDKTFVSLSSSTTKEQVARGDIRFTKVAEESGEPMPGVAFLITSKTTGERHVLVTDESGVASTDSTTRSHLDNTNASDAAIESSGRVIDETSLSPNGIWFSGAARTTTTPDDSLGAMPYDTYSVIELRSSATLGHALGSFEVTIDEDSQVVDLGTVTDPALGIRTVASDQSDGDKFLSNSGHQVIEDEVSYFGLEPGSEYQLYGLLVDADSGKPISGGSDIASVNITFVPTESDGSITMAFPIEPGSQSCRNIVVTEMLYSDEELIAAHVNLDDSSQTVYIPQLSTSASFSDGSKTAVAGGSTTITDAVTYSGLIPGLTYRLVMTLVDTESNTAIELNGSTVSCEQYFTPSEQEGVEEINLALPETSTLSGSSVVVFERLYCNDLIVAAHEDIGDTDQTVSFQPTANPVALPNTGSILTIARTVCLGLFVAALAVGNPTDDESRS